MSRDLAGNYAEAARKGAPQAIQVADCYHLVANLREAIQKLLDRKRSYLPLVEETASALEKARSPLPAPLAQSVSQDGKRQEAHKEEEQGAAMKRAEALRQVRRHKRYARYQAVMDLHQQGLGARMIARQLGISRNTIRSYLKAETFPEQGLRSKRRSQVDPYSPYLRERWQAGFQNAAQLIREITSRGYRRSPSVVRALVSGWCATSPSIARPTRGNKRRASAPAKRRLSPSQASFLFVKQPNRLSDTQHKYLLQICQGSDEMQQTRELAQEFVSIISTHLADQLDGWLERVKEHGLRELKSFATGIRRDYGAVRAGLSNLESNGQV